MTKSNRNSLLYDCYQYQIQEIHSNKCWLSQIKDILCNTGFEEIWYNQHVENEDQLIKDLRTKVQTKFITQAKQEMNKDKDNDISGGNKLRTFRKFKGDFKLENYITDIKNKNLRKNITKLRISAHDLMIEKGRYHRPYKIPVDERICSLCDNNAVEDEKHVVNTCPKYTQEREILHNTITQHNPKFTDLTEEEKFIYIMQCTSKPQNLALATYLKKVVTIRGKI